MLRPRVIPCLLIQEKGLVKTINFKEGKYIGDPINAVKIFNEKEADELMVIDIDASTNGSEPDFLMIQNIAAECRMPLCYGGGIKNIEQARRIIGLGVEKVALSSAAIENTRLISDLANELGSQSVVVVLDVKRKLLGTKYEVFTYNGKKNTGLDPIDFVRIIEENGAGEIVINSIDNDGKMKGYDLALAKKVREQTSLPMTILGGAGSFNDIEQLISCFGIVGAAAGSLFVFKGNYKAVLINYPRQKEKDDLLRHFIQG